MNRIIWVLREPRTGGSWFIDKCAALLNRSSYFFESIREFDILPMPRKETYFINRPQHKDDTTRILNTHEFSAVSSFKNYDNPIIIRISRKNKTEQFLSFYLANLTRKTYNSVKFYNVYNQETLSNMPNYTNLVVEAPAIKQFIKRQKIVDDYWNKIKNVYDTEVIYYEDLLVNYHSKLLNVSFDMNMDHIEKLPLKLPYNKKEIFLNYDLIDKQLSA